LEHEYTSFQYQCDDELLVCVDTPPIPGYGQLAAGLHRTPYW